MYRDNPASIAAIAMATAVTVMPAQAGECQPGQLGELVREGKDIYLGEMHGSAEVPALVRCLIEVALASKHENLFVSLEQQPTARDPSSDLWRGTDGRASEAMWALTQYVIREEKAGHLEFHQQLPDVFTLEAGQNPPS